MDLVVIASAQLVKKEITDTLRTHPDCAKRKIYAENYFGKHPNTGTDFFLSSHFRIFFNVCRAASFSVLKIISFFVVRSMYGQEYFCDDAHRFVVRRLKTAEIALESGGVHGEHRAVRPVNARKLSPNGPKEKHG